MDMNVGVVGRQGGTASPFRTRREHIHVDSDETSCFIRSGREMQYPLGYEDIILKILPSAVRFKQVVPVSGWGFSPGTVSDRKSRPSPHGCVHGESQD
jgi:hypothetical protein